MVVHRQNPNQSSVANHGCRRLLTGNRHRDFVALLKFQHKAKIRLVGEGWWDTLP